MSINYTFSDRLLTESMYNIITLYPQALMVKPCNKITQTTSGFCINFQTKALLWTLSFLLLKVDVSVCNFPFFIGVSSISKNYKIETIKNASRQELFNYF